VDHHIHWCLYVGNSLWNRRWVDIQMFEHRNPSPWRRHDHLTVAGIDHHASNPRSIGWELYEVAVPAIFPWLLSPNASEGPAWSSWDRAQFSTGLCRALSSTSVQKLLLYSWKPHEDRIRQMRSPWFSSRRNNQVPHKKPCVCSISNYLMLLILRG
jgi:hypothetical protein